MKIVNGKLLGQPKDDLDIFKEKIEERCDRIEILLSKKQEEQISKYQDNLEKIYYSQQILDKRIQAVENNQLNYFEGNLAIIKQYIPRKLLWLTLWSSLTIGLIFFLSWLKFEPEYKCKFTKEETFISILANKKLARN